MYTSSWLVRMGVVASAFLSMLVLSNLKIMGVDQVNQTVGGVDDRLAPDGNTISLWAHFLNCNITRASTPDDVSKILKEKSCNTGRIALGGTGAFELAFRLDDYLELHVLFDGDEKISGWTLCRTIDGWLKQPDGIIVFANSSPILTHGLLDADKPSGANSKQL